MEKRTVELAKQLLSSVPKREMEDLIQLLRYYNRADEGQRINAMKYGFTEPTEPSLEKETRVLIEKAAASQDVYVMSNTPVCRCCGK